MSRINNRINNIYDIENLYLKNNKNKSDNMQNLINYDKINKKTNYILNNNINSCVDSNYIQITKDKFNIQENSKSNYNKDKNIDSDKKSILSNNTTFSSKLNNKSNILITSCDFYLNYLSKLSLNKLDLNFYTPNKLNNILEYKVSKKSSNLSNINNNNNNFSCTNTNSILNEDYSIKNKINKEYVNNKDLMNKEDSCLLDYKTKEQTRIISCSMQTLKSIYNGYIDHRYPDISLLKKKYSLPYIKIDVKKNSIYFIIKSFNIENIHKAIKYNVWSTTYSGNILFNQAYTLAQSRDADVYLFFSTNSTFAFQGIAKLESNFQPKSYSFWKGSDKFKSFNGSFIINWLIIKDIPNSTLDKILVNNIPFSKLRNGVEISEQDALGAVNLYENFYYCSSLVLSDFMRLDIEENAIIK